MRWLIVYHKRRDAIEAKRRSNDEKIDGRQIKLLSYQGGNSIMVDSNDYINIIRIEDFFSKFGCLEEIKAFYPRKAKCKKNSSLQYWLVEFGESKQEGLCDMLRRETNGDYKLSVYNDRYLYEIPISYASNLWYLQDKLIRYGTVVSVKLLSDFVITS